MCGSEIDLANVTENGIVSVIGTGVADVGLLISEMPDDSSKEGDGTPSLPVLSSSKAKTEPGWLVSLSCVDINCRVPSILKKTTKNQNTKQPRKMRESHLEKRVDL